MDEIVCGIFVGGASSRMGGGPKGLLHAPSGEPIAARWLELFREIGAPAVLIGRLDRTAPYAHLGALSIEDEPDVEGPLAGLVALLRYAAPRCAIAVACDMPFVSRELLRKLMTCPSGAPIVAPYRDGRWEPLFARHDSPRVLAAAIAHARGARRSLQPLFDELGAEKLALTSEEELELADWDTPADVTGRPGS